MNPIDVFLVGCWNEHSKKFEVCCSSFPGIKTSSDTLFGAVNKLKELLDEGNSFSDFQTNYW